MNIALITGTNSGLGKELAIAFEKTGWKVVRLARPNWDLSKDISRSFENLLGGLDESADRALLVHNAASHPIKQATATNTDEINEAMRVNVISPISLTSLFLRKFPKGEIAAITSAAVHEPEPHWALYIAGKAAMLGYLRALKAEGVTCHEIDPGLMDTPMQERIRASGFPGVNRFDAFKRFGKLQVPGDVAAKVLLELAVV
jgi:short-subunit dehydrogenase